MKLESYAIQQAVQMDKIDLAIDLVSQYFNLPRPHCMPKLHQASPGEPLSVVMWDHFYYYGWSSDLGFRTTDNRVALDRREVKVGLIQVFRTSAL